MILNVAIASMLSIIPVGVPEPILDMSSSTSGHRFEMSTPAQPVVDALTAYP